MYFLFDEVFQKNGFLEIPNFANFVIIICTNARE